MSRYILCKPIDGRDYKSDAEVLADWNADHDFIVIELFSGSGENYINRQAVSSGVAVGIRYDEGRKLCVINV